MAGEPDSGFGVAGTGKVATENPSPRRATFGAVALQADGRIVAAGSSFNGATNDIVVACYNPDGTLDPQFGIEGRMTRSIGPLNDSAFAVAVQPDERIVTAGRSQTGPTFGPTRFAVARFLPDGMLDPSFATVGATTTDLGTRNSIAFAVVVQPDGKIVAIGFASDSASTSTMALVRYNANGALDTGFGTGGKVKAPPGSANAAALQRDGKILAAGAVPSGAATDFAVARYNPNGTLDASFGTGGKVTTSIGPGNDSISGIGVQADGKIVVGGTTFNGTSEDFAVARYNANGSLDTTFGSGGKVTTSLGAFNDRANDLALQPDGKIVVVGNTFKSKDAAAFAVVRYNANGTLDPTFGTGGKVITAVGANDFAAAVAIQPDGKVLVAGNTSDLVHTDLALVRYHGRAVT
ncbi:MAG TPA: delta-60 repeat domain-containing protein [Acidimicrobiales bacterium]|nr:delta-60 repeat domain-containing protein [Acidimicrobiales bacterium]